MTHRSSESLPLTPSPRRRWLRSALRGLAIGAAVLGAGWVVVAAPAMSPPTIAAPLVKGLYLPANDTARVIYVQQLLDSGYQFTPLMQLDDA